MSQTIGFTSHRNHEMVKVVKAEVTLEDLVVVVEVVTPSK
jgi:hypothetical protein